MAVSKTNILIGCIINKLNSPDHDEYGFLAKEEDIDADFNLAHWQDLAIFKGRHFDLLGTVTWEMDLIAPRVVDISDYLDATVINDGDMQHRRFRSVAFCARTVSNLVSYLSSGTLDCNPR